MSRRQHDSQAGRSWEDRVLDEIIKGPVTGQARPGHRWGWVSAAHVLTERLCDLRPTINSISIGEHATSYRWVCDAIAYLEQADLIVVQRSHSGGAARGNTIEHIALKEG